MKRIYPFGLVALLVGTAPVLVAVQGQPVNRETAGDTVRAILAPRSPLPSEAATAGITKFSFIAYGDTRGRYDGERLQYEHGLVVQSMLKTISAMANGPDPVRFVTWSGDAVVDGRVAQQYNRSFSDIVDQITNGAGLPFFPSPGNHDVAHTSSRSAPERLVALRNYYGAFRALIPPEGTPRRLNGYPTYAFGYGNTFLIGWDSNILGDTVQYDWIRRQLEGLDRQRYPNIVVFEHQPAFSSGGHGAAVLEPQAAEIRSWYMPLFRKHHVRLMLTGHEHLFEHWVERYNDESGKAYRLDQIVSGGGGAPLYGYRGEPDLRDYLKLGAAANVSVQHLVKPGIAPGENPYHYVVVHVDGEHIRVDVIGVEFGSDFAPYRSRSADLDSVVPNMR